MFRTHTLLPVKIIIGLWVSTSVEVLNAAILPTPDIKLNAVDGALTVLSNESLSLSLSLDSGASEGSDADWWLVHFTGDSSTSFNTLTSRFEAGLDPGLQTELFSFPSLSLLTVTATATGPHDYCFAVDTVMNGVPDWDNLYYDCAGIKVKNSDSLIRGFTLPAPLFADDSAWRQTVSDAAILPNNSAIITTTYRVLRGDNADLVDEGSINWPYIELNYNDYTVPVFQAATETGDVFICDYDGILEWPNPKYPGEYEMGGPVPVPLPVGMVRPGGPQGRGIVNGEQEFYPDGWMVLYQPDTGMEYDFWTATTSRDGECQSHGAGYLGAAVTEAGYTDFFDTAGYGNNPDDVSSARAVGTPLLAGLLLPEDIAGGEIAHTLAFAIPGPRNLGTAGEPTEPSEYAYPAATTEAEHYSVNPNAMIAGQRIRLRQSIADDEGVIIDESSLIPVTQMFLAALRKYGAIMVDNAGGFIFYAEDIHTGNLAISDDQVNALIGEAAGTALPAGKTKWQIVVEALHEELVEIPIAYGPWEDDDDPTTATVGIRNFDVVTSATRPE